MTSGDMDLLNVFPAIGVKDAAFSSHGPVGDSASPPYLLSPGDTVTITKDGDSMVLGITAPLLVQLFYRPIK